MLVNPISAALLIEMSNHDKSSIIKCVFLDAGIHGEHTESVGGVYDISNKRRLGLTEYDAIMEMKKGVEEILKKEKELQGDK